jgi:hypothetical protein
LRQPAGEHDREPAVVVAHRQLGVGQVNRPHMSQQGQILLRREHLRDDFRRDL